MKIAFLHYHLKTGGVTTVLHQQSEAIRKDCQCLIIAGSAPESDIAVKFAEIPQLGYTQRDHKPFDPADIAESIMTEIHSAFDGKCDVLHVHNPTLAKNKHFLDILQHLQRKNVNLFLQIHDFAEDGRPSVYFPDEYPKNCHYGVLNTRDYNILLKAGLSAKGVHQIPNMVSPVQKTHDRPAVGNYVLYPIRAIRRKNIGEAILLSYFLPNDTRLLITLPPNSPMDISSYRDWISFVQKHHLPVEFDAGVDKEFRELVQGARSLITTSITEGFGFSFLEPWMYDKLLWGRNLIPITQDFEQKGIRLNHLYPRLMVPVEWIGRSMFFEQWQSCIRQTCDRFHYPIQQDRINASFEEMTASGLIDFGLLNESFQKKDYKTVAGLE